MKIARRTEHNGLALRNTFLLVRPLPSKLDRCLDSLGACVHGQHHIIPEHFRDLLGKLSEHGIVKCSRRQRQLLRLLNQGSQDPRVTVPLEQKIKVYMSA